MCNLLEDMEAERSHLQSTFKMSLFWLLNVFTMMEISTFCFSLESENKLFTEYIHLSLSVSP